MKSKCWSLYISRYRVWTLMQAMVGLESSLGIWWCLWRGVSHSSISCWLWRIDSPSPIICWVWWGVDRRFYGGCSSFRMSIHISIIRILMVLCWRTGIDVVVASVTGTGWDAGSFGQDGTVVHSDKIDSFAFGFLCFLTLISIIEFFMIFAVVINERCNC